MSNTEHIRTSEDIVAEFSEQAQSILSGNKARLEINSKHGGEVGDKFLYRSAITRGRGHSVISCRDGNQK